MIQVLSRAHFSLIDTIAQVSFENAEDGGEDRRERRRTKSGTSTSLSEKYSLNTSSEADQPTPGQEVVLVDFTKHLE